MSYAQGFSELRAASKRIWLGFYHLGDIAKNFGRAGCIIRARFLQKITDAYEKDADLANLMLDDYFKEITDKYQQAVRGSCCDCCSSGGSCTNLLICYHLL